MAGDGGSSGSGGSDGSNGSRNADDDDLLGPSEAMHGPPTMLTALGQSSTATAHDGQPLQRYIAVEARRGADDARRRPLSMPAASA